MKRRATNLGRTLVSCALLTVLLVNMSGLLLRAGDIESNPGPEYNDVCSVGMLREQEGRLSNFLERTVNVVGNSLSHMLHSCLGAMMHELQAVRHSQSQVETRFESELREMQQTVKDLRDRLEFVTTELEDKVEKLETETRKNNLKFFNVPESDEDDFAACVRTVIDLLTAAVPSIDWKAWDFSRAFRLGPYRENQQAPRPLLVQFERGSDRMAVLTEGRSELRKNGVTVAADLTERQKAVIDDHRQQGLSAYFKGSKLVIGGRLRHQGGRSQQEAEPWQQRDPRRHFQQSETRPSGSQQQRANRWQPHQPQRNRIPAGQRRHFNEERRGSVGDSSTADWHRGPQNPPRLTGPYTDPPRGGEQLPGPLRPPSHSPTPQRSSRKPQAVNHANLQPVSMAAEERKVAESVADELAPSPADGVMPDATNDPGPDSRVQQEVERGGQVAGGDGDQTNGDLREHEGEQGVSAVSGEASGGNDGKQQTKGQPVCERQLTLVESLAGKASAKR